MNEWMNEFERQHTQLETQPTHTQEKDGEKKIVSNEQTIQCRYRCFVSV